MLKDRLYHGRHGHSSLETSPDAGSRGTERRSVLGASAAGCPAASGSPESPGELVRRLVAPRSLLPPPCGTRPRLSIPQRCSCSLLRSAFSPCFSVSAVERGLRRTFLPR